MIVVVDNGVGNLGSILNMLKRIGAKAVISSDTRDILAASKLILPGVGAFDRGMQLLRELDLVGVLDQQVRGAGVPMLGICLGMQLLARRSAEGGAHGLGWLDAEVVRFDPNRAANVGALKVPHMGWNEVSVRSGDDPIFRGFDTSPRFYFVHSYHMVCQNQDDVIGVTHHGYEFPAAVRNGSVWGVQFHPEKSHRFGMRLLTNFLSVT
jgi:glutamine amidotransferase